MQILINFIFSGFSRGKKKENCCCLTDELKKRNVVICCCWIYGREIVVEDERD